MTIPKEQSPYPDCLTKQSPSSHIKAWEDLTIADDYMFKLVMKHKHICKHLLEIILRVKIRDIKEPETEKALKNSFEGRGIRLDVYVEDDANTVYDVEMQVRQYPMATLGRRTRYYQSVIAFGSLQAGVYYDKLKNLSLSSYALSASLTATATSLLSGKPASKIKTLYWMTALSRFS